MSVGIVVGRGTYIPPEKGPFDELLSAGAEVCAGGDAAGVVVGVGE